MHTSLRIILLALLSVGALESLVADPGDTTVVATFDEEFQNWADWHFQTFWFGQPQTQFFEVWLDIELGCPGPPGDCDPWDRTAKLVVRRPSGSGTEDIEIARYITPYDITGGNRPGTCTWRYDMLEYLPLLRDSVTLGSYIESWIGGNQGWLVTATFYFVEGAVDYEVYRIENLWNVGYLGIGDPGDPWETHLGETAVATDPSTAFITIRVVTTGHGQGNTLNAAEFSRLDHGVWVNGQYFEHELWRDDCHLNPCSPQGGTWQFARAGWCPGSKVYPWDNSGIVFTPGDSLYISPYIEAYENFCRPNNPDCISGQTCADCNYNSTGHTSPNYNTTGQIIYWRAASTDAERPTLPAARDLALTSVYPNPFNAVTTIQFDLPGEGHARITVFDLQGREITKLLDGRLSAGAHATSWQAASTPSGVYFCSLEFGGRAVTRKLLLLK